MPKTNDAVHRCVQHLMAKGFPEGNAIAICQKSTGMSYHSGKKISGKKKSKTEKKR